MGVRIGFDVSTANGNPYPLFQIRRFSLFVSIICFGACPRHLSEKVIVPTKRLQVQTSAQLSPSELLNGWVGDVFVGARAATGASELGKEILLARCNRIQRIIGWGIQDRGGVDA